MTEWEGEAILVVDDDDAFRHVLCAAFARRRITPLSAATCDEALALIRSERPRFAVLDLRLHGNENGLALVQAFKAIQNNMRIVILTGYASIPTAVQAIKLGADYYLAKPVRVDSILQSFHGTCLDARQDDMAGCDQPTSLAKLEWEHIQKVLAEYDGNISATARALNMHRRTLQRKLTRYAPRK